MICAISYGKQIIFKTMTKEQLSKILLLEHNQYRNYTFPTTQRWVMSWIKNEPLRTIMKWQKYSRIADFYHLKVINGSKLSILPYLWYARLKNTLAYKLSIELPTEKIGKGLLLFHSGSTVVNENAIIGDYCKLHGNNCIGNDGTPGGKCPIIGNNVSIGVGAKIIGDIRIADNITIGAGAVVVDSFTEEGVTIGGIPAKVIRRP